MLERVRLVNKMRFRLKRRKISTRLFQVIELDSLQQCCGAGAGGAEII